MLLGGLTAADASRTDVRIAAPRGDRAAGDLPTALHDTAAVPLGDAVYLFGGGTGANTQSDAILRVPLGGGTATSVGRLPAPSSDQSAAAIGGTAYVVGGYTGSRWLDTIVAWRPGGGAHVVAHLPAALRYAAVAAAGGKLVIAGGSLESGAASRDVLAFDPRRNRVSRLGRLPAPTTHAAAATLGGIVYVIGGRGASTGTPTGRIVSVDPVRGRIRAAGSLSVPRSDLAAVATGGRILLAGGRSAAGTEALLARLTPKAKTAATSVDVYAHDRPGDLAPAARAAKPLVYVPNSLSDTVDVIDPRTDKIVEHFAVGGLPQHVVPSWDLKTLYVTNDTGNSLTAIDPRTGKPGRTIPVDDPYNMYFTPDGRYAIVVAERLHRLDFRDAHSFRVHHRLNVPCAGVDHMDFTADGRYLLASCEFSGEMVQVDVAAERVVRTIPLPDGASGMPQDVKLSSDGRTFYVADMHANGVWKIGAASFERARLRADRQGRARALREPRRRAALRHESQRGLDLGRSTSARRRWSRPGGSPAAAAPTWGTSRPTGRRSGSPVATTGRCTRSRRGRGSCWRGSRSARGRTASASGRSRGASRSGTPASSGDPRAGGRAARPAARRRLRLEPHGGPGPRDLRALLQRLPHDLGQGERRVRRRPGAAAAERRRPRELRPRDARRPAARPGGRRRGRALPPRRRRAAPLTGLGRLASGYLDSRWPGASHGKAAATCSRRCSCSWRSCLRSARASAATSSAAATRPRRRAPSPSRPGARRAGEGASQGQAQQISPAPAFSADELNALPGENWITNGGSLANQRYSPLDEIDTSNVAQLKGVWRTHLQGSATASKYSAEAQPIVYDGVVYVPTGEDDVFAVSVDTGKILWTYKGSLDETISTVCCGWLSRGVAIGEGKLYLGKLDGSLVALDQKTGKEVWKTQVGRWQDGYTITAAPLYYDGMVVTGVSGGEFGIRGRVTAYDASDGKERWRFYTIPGPGETGHDSWPAGNDSWKHGGAPVWQTPSVDPQLGLIYFSTGNASPDLDGSKRAGDNLFNTSIVAIDAKTGTYKWHYQYVHHDIWDYDAPSPTVLFDVEVNGETRHGIAEAAKTGWLYMLDRETGKPLYPIPEKPVPQSAEQHTSKTQPIPSYDPFIPHTPTKAQVAEIRKLATKNAKGGKTLPVKAASEIYTPFWKDAIVVDVPGPQGGTNWQPTSYNPKTQMFYVCAQAAASGYTAETQQPAKQKQVKQSEIGSVFTTGGFGTNPGTFTAIDATSGKIAWQKNWPESCYAGSSTSGGGLVFVGRNNGELQAYGAQDGKQLWSFQTGAGANNSPTIFERNGHEYLVYYSGGNALAATAHGDNLWLFSLDGKLGPAKPAGGGAGVGHAGESTNTPSQKAGDATAGKQVFLDNCSGCHGTNGTGGNGGPDLTGIPSAKQLTTVLGQVRNGGGGMPAFKGTLTDKQIRDVSAYVVEEITHGSTGG